MATSGGTAGALRAVVTRVGARLLAEPPAAPVGRQLLRSFPEAVPLPPLPRPSAVVAVGSPSASRESVAMAEGATQSPGFSRRSAYATES